MSNKTSANRDVWLLFWSNISNLSIGPCNITCLYQLWMIWKWTKALYYKAYSVTFSLCCLPSPQQIKHLYTVSIPNTNTQKEALSKSATESHWKHLISFEAFTKRLHSFFINLVPNRASSVKWWANSAILLHILVIQFSMDILSVRTIHRNTNTIPKIL